MKIDPQDRSAISALFDQALDLPAQERRLWLAELPPSQRAYRPTLELLLANYARVETQDFLNTLPKVAVSEEPLPDDGAGRRVGPYRLLRELGRGGMRSVCRSSLCAQHAGLDERAF